MNKKRQESLFWGIILLIIGGIFLMDNLGMDIDIWQIIGDYWPVLLIVIGIQHIWRYYNSQKQ